VILGVEVCFKLVLLAFGLCAPVFDPVCGSFSLFFGFVAIFTELVKIDDSAQNTLRWLLLVARDGRANRIEPPPRFL